MPNYLRFTRAPEAKPNTVTSVGACPPVEAELPIVSISFWAKSSVRPDEAHVIYSIHPDVGISFCEDGGATLEVSRPIHLRELHREFRHALTLTGPPDLPRGRWFISVQLVAGDGMRGEGLFCPLYMEMS
jgi:hypothetical protein